MFFLDLSLSLYTTIIYKAYRLKHIIYNYKACLQLSILFLKTYYFINIFHFKCHSLKKLFLISSNLPIKINLFSKSNKVLYFLLEFITVHNYIFICRVIIELWFPPLGRKAPQRQRETLSFCSPLSN